jgi:alkylation response protein AidB-like acyl-CoA dehydrogenase
MARTDPGNRGAGGISAFIVPADSPGISLGKPDRKMGQRGAKTCDVILEDVLVPAANIIGGVPAVLVAAYIVKSLPLTALRWLVAIVVAYTAVTLIMSARRKPDQAELA